MGKEGAERGSPSLKSTGWIFTNFLGFSQKVFFKKSYLKYSSLPLTNVLLAWLVKLTIVKLG